MKGWFGLFPHSLWGFKFQKGPLIAPLYFSIAQSLAHLELFLSLVVPRAQELLANHKLELGVSKGCDGDYFMLISLYVFGINFP